MANVFPLKNLRDLAEGVVDVERDDIAHHNIFKKDFQYDTFPLSHNDDFRALEALERQILPQTNAFLRKRNAVIKEPFQRLMIDHSPFRGASKSKGTAAWRGPQRFQPLTIVLTSFRLPKKRKLTALNGASVIDGTPLVPHKEAAFIRILF